MTVLHWLLPVIGIGFVIFFHELGHYLAARAMGVRVEAFSIGFGPRIIGFRRGTTDWKICLIPLGGFVKMAGETPNAPRTGASDEFSSKSVAARSLIISAGVIMNVIFALVALPIAFMIGVPFEAPVIGSVEPGRPAWRAGLQAGDRILAVDGRRTLGFEDIVTAIAIGGDVVALEAERAGARRTFEVPTVRDERRGLPMIGVTPTFAAIEIRPEDVDPSVAEEADRALAEHRRAAGMRVGDRVLDVDGVPVSALVIPGDLTEMRSRKLRIDRGGAVVEVVLPPFAAPVDAESPELFGFSPANLTVKDVVPGSPAAALGLSKDDRIVRVGGHDLLQVSELVSLLASTTSDAPVAVERGGAVVDLPARLSDAEVRRSLRSDVEYVPTGSMVVPIEGGAAAAAGVRRGDVITSVEGNRVQTFQDVAKIDPAVKTATFGVTRAGAEGSTETFSITRTRAPLNQVLFGLEHAYVRETVRTGLGASLKAGFDYTVMMTARVFMTLKSLFSRRVSAENLGGIITIFRQSVDSSKIAFSRGLLFMAVISINLAVLNVLPIPVLDGGWLLLLMIEKLRGRPVSERVMGIVSWIGLVLILALMVFVTWNDIRRLIWPFG